MKRPSDSSVKRHSWHPHAKSHSAAGTNAQTPLDSIASENGSNLHDGLYGPKNGVFIEFPTTKILDWPNQIKGQQSHVYGDRAAINNKINGFQKLNGRDARSAEQYTTSKTAYQMQKSHRKLFGHTVQAILFPAYLLTGVEQFKYIFGIKQQQSNAYGLRPSHKSQRSRRRFKV